MIRRKKRRKKTRPAKKKINANLLPVLDKTACMSASWPHSQSVRELICKKEKKERKVLCLSKATELFRNQTKKKLTVLNENLAGGGGHDGNFLNNLFLEIRADQYGSLYSCRGCGLRW